MSNDRPHALPQDVASVFGNPPGKQQSASGPQSQMSASEEAIRRAHQFVSPDLYVIERMTKSGIEPDYSALFGAQIQAKIAALMLLTRQKLLDIHRSSMPTREIEEARRDLASYVQVLFHLKSAEALGIFYDFAASFWDGRTPGLWANVCARCLHLLALLPERFDTVSLFLKNRIAAQRRLHELAKSAKPELAHSVRPLVTAFMKHQASGFSELQPSPTPAYVLLYQQYERELIDDEAVGVSSWLSAKDRIEQAVIAGDIPGVIAWISEGSPAAMRETLRYAESVMSQPQYVDLLERALHLDSLSAKRKITVVLELGSQNRKANIPTGESTLNRILAHLAMTDHADYLEVAKAAVRELGSVKAHKQLMAILEHAPQLAVAIEAIEVFKKLRHLHIAKEAVEKRPELQLPFQTAYRHIQELRSLTDAVASCLSDETMTVYLERLKIERAIPELQELARQRTRTGECAVRMLTEIDPSLAVDYYK